MSVVGKRETTDPSSGRMPPIVVSRNAIDAAVALPEANPRRPGHRRKVEKVGQSKGLDLADESWLPGPASSSLIPFGSVTKKRGPDIKGDSLTAGPSSPVRPPNQLTNHEAHKLPLWQYLMMYLPLDTPLTNSPMVTQLLPLARQRELSHRWKFQLASGHPTARTLCAVVVYLSGIKASSPCDVCASYDGTTTGNGQIGPVVLPFPECIKLPDGASAQLQEYFGPTACCNHFYKSVPGRGKQSYCISRFSLSSSSDLGVDHPVAESDLDERATSFRVQDTSSDSKNDSDSNAEGNRNATRLVLSPTAICNSPAYRTALPAKMAGRPRVVSIKKASKSIPAAKAKRQSSIRRLAAKLGAKAARREVAVYKPSEATVQEQQETEAQSTIT